jgi:hypothetical protein
MDKGMESIINELHIGGLAMWGKPKLLGLFTTITM